MYVNEHAHRACPTARQTLACVGELRRDESTIAVCAHVASHTHAAPTRLLVCTCAFAMAAVVVVMVVMMIVLNSHCMHYLCVCAAAAIQCSERRRRTVECHCRHHTRRRRCAGSIRRCVDEVSAHIDTSQLLRIHSAVLNNACSNRPLAACAAATAAVGRATGTTARCKRYSLPL